MDLPELFKQHLQKRKHPASAATLKNYLADLRQFSRWFEDRFERSFEPRLITSEIVTLYLTEKTKQSPRSAKRYGSSLRKYFDFLLEKGDIRESPLKTTGKELQISVDPWHLKDFKNYLYVFNASAQTIKNYINDTKQFTNWAAKNLLGSDVSTAINILSLINNETLVSYQSYLSEELGLSLVSIKRKLSSLRKYLTFANEQGYLKPEISAQLKKAPQPNLVGEESVEKEALQASLSMPSEAISPLKPSPKAYSRLAPLRLVQKVGRLGVLAFDATIILAIAKGLEQLQYLSWLASGKQVFVKSAKNISNYASKLKHPVALVTAGIASEAVANSGLFGAVNALTHQVEKTKTVSKFHPTHPHFVTLSLYSRLFGHARFTRPNWYKRYHSHTVVHYFHFAALIIFMSALGFSLYKSFVLDPRQQEALAALPTAPPRILSFQGRLTDANSNPITIATDLRFAVYDNLTASGAALLWQETQFVTPDPDGIFSVLLGTSTPIPSTLFSENASLFLGITVEQDPELVPRQQLATVPYAANSETLQGLPPITAVGAGQTNVVLALDSGGDLTIGGSASPTFAATGGAFEISGNVLNLTTTAGSNADVNIEPNGLGKIDLLKPLQNTSLNNNIPSAAGSVEVDDLFSILATSSGQSAFTLNQNGAGPIISASASGVARFTLENDGTGIFAGDVAVNGGDITSTGDLTLNPAGGQVFLADIDTLTIGGHAGDTYNAISNAGGTPTNPNVTSDNDLYVQGDVDIGGTLFLNGTQITTGSLVNYWQRNLGTVSPANITDDLLIGGTATSSAAWQVFGFGANAGTASSSAQITFRGTTDPKINILNDENFGIRTSPGGDAGLTERLTILNNGNIGIGSTAPTATLNVVGTLTQATGQVTLGGNVDATSGLDVTGANLTVGGTNFTVDQSNGNITTIGDLAVNGDDITSDGSALTININGGSAGNLLLADTDTFAIGGFAAGSAYNAISNAGGTPTNPNVTTDNDLYVQGDIDIGGTLYLNGTQLTPGALVNYWQRNLGAVAPNNITDDVLIGGTATASALIKFPGLTNNNAFFNLGTGNVGVGTTTPLAKLESFGTTEQLRLSYDGSNRTSFTVSSGGDLTIAPTGGDSNITGTLDVSGHGAFGGSAAVSTATVLNVSETLNDVTASSGLSVTPNLNLSSDFTSTFFGVRNNPTISGTGNQLTGRVGAYTTGLTYNSTGTASNISTAEFVTVAGASAGAVTFAFNIYSRIDNNSANAITNAYNYYSANSLGTGSLTNFYGLYVGALSDGTANNIGIQIDTPSGATNNFALYLSGTGGTAASGINFGIDTNLYRSAANTLRTDDNFITALDLTVSGGDITGANGAAIDIGEATSGDVEITGDLLPATDDTYDLGSTAKSWQDLFLTGQLCFDDTNCISTPGGYWQRLAGNLSPLTLNDTISATTSAATALTITQTGAFDALLVQDEAGDASPFVIKSDGNVGIGTTAPERPLEIYFNNTNTSTLQANFRQDGTGDAGLNFSLGTGGASFAFGIDNSDSDKFKIGYSATGPSNVNSNTRITIDTAGNIGIGTDNPSLFKLQLEGSIGPDNDDTYDLGSSTRRWRDLYLGPASVHIGTDGNEATIGYNITDNYIQLDSDGNGTPDTVLTDAGNLGIGTTTPLAKLDVAGAASVSGNLTLYGGARTIQTTTNNPLTIGGNSTGDITFAPLNGTGAVLPSVNNSVDIGSPSLQFDTLYIQNIVQNGSPINLTNYWQRLAGNLSPINLNDTISATTSASTLLTLTQTGAFDVVRFEDEASDATPFLIDQSGNTTIGGDLTITGGNITNLITFDNGLTATGTLTANGTLDGNGLFTLGDNGETGAIDTSDWDISTTGALSGITNISNDGTYTQTGAGQNTFSGNVDATSGLDVTGANLTVGGSAFTVTTGGVITAATDETINGIDINAAAVSDVTSLSLTTVGNTWASGALAISGDFTLSGGDITGANGAAVDIGEATSGDIEITGDLLPATDATYDIGSTAKSWKDIYLTGNLCFDDTDCISASGGYWTRVAGNIFPTTLNDTVSATSSAGVVATFTGTRTGAGNIFLVEDAASDASPFAINEVGDVTIGGDLAITGGNVTTATTFDSTLTITGTLTANGTLDANGLFTLGDNGETGAIDTSDWDISTTGSLTGISGITTDGGYTQSGSSTNTLSGATTISSTGTALTLSGAATTAINISNTGVTTDISLQNGETIDNNVDDFIEFQGVGGTDNTDLAIDLDGTHPVLTSPTDTVIEIAENLTVSGTGTHDIAGTLNLSGNTLTSTGDLTLNPGGGQVLFADTDTFAIGGHAGAAYNAISDSGGTPANSDVTADNDLYVQGDVDIGGTLYVNGSPASVVNYWQRLAGNVSPVTLNDTISATSSAGVVATFTGTRTGSGAIFLVEDSASDATPFMIDNNGNVGIQTTGSSVATLTVQGTGHFQGDLTTVSDLIVDGGNVNFGAATIIGDGGDALTLNSSGTLTVDDTTLAFSDAGTITTGGTNTALTLDPTGTGTIQFHSASNTIDASGNLTIAGDLRVNGNDLLDSAGTTRITLGDTTIITATTTQLSGLLDVNGSGTHDIAGTLNLSGNTLTSTGDLTLNPGGGNILLADTDVLNVGGAAATAYNFFANSTAGASGSMIDDDDLYIQGNLEVDGTIVGTINPGFTTGSVVFQGPSGFAQDNTNFFWDDTNNRLGLGTPTPAFSLDLQGSGGLYNTNPKALLRLANTDANAANNQSTIQFSANRAGDIQTPIASISAILTNVGATTYTGDLAFSTAGTAAIPTERLRITGAGNVGIGSTSPTAGFILDAIGRARFSTGLSVGTTATTNTLELVGTLNQTTGQVTFGGNVDATAGLDVTGANLTVGGANFSVTTAGVLTAASNGAFGGVLQAGSTLTVAYSRLGTGVTGNGLDAANDLLITDDLEVDGTIFFDGSLDTAFTPGSVVFAGTDGVLTEDNGQLFWDDTLNRLGIGTSAPGTALTVNGTTRAKAFEDFDNTVYYLDPAATGATASLLTAGNVGIGTTDGVLAALNVNGSGGVFGTSLKDIVRLVNNDATATNNGVNQSFWANRTGGILTNIASVSAIMTNNGATTYTGALAFSTAGTAAVPTERMRITADGNVGIGTTTPSQKLSVMLPASTFGTIAGFGANTVQDLFQIGFSSGGVTSITSSTFGRFEIITQSNNHIALMPNGTGNVGIGTTAPVSPLHVFGTNNTTDGTDGTFLSLQNASNSTDVMTGIRFQNGTALPSYKGGIFYQDKLSNGRGDILFINNATASNTNATAADTRMIIKNDGNVGIGTTVPIGRLDVAGTGGVYGTSLQNTLSLINNDATATNNGVNQSFWANRTGGVLTNIASVSAIMSNNGATTYTGELAFSTAGTAAVPTERVRISSSGNVGIGETSPDSKLEIAAGGNGPALLNLHNTASGGKDLYFISTATGAAAGAGVLVITDDPALSTGSGAEFRLDFVNAQLDLATGLEFNVPAASGTFGICHTTNGAQSNAVISDCNGAPGDIAEWYPTKTNVTEGEIVSLSNNVFEYDSKGINPLTGVEKNLGRQKINILEKATVDSRRIIGVISSGPYQTYGEDILDAVQSSNDPSLKAMPLALNGRVPVKVSLENGDIQPGDYLTISSTPGVAMKSKNAEFIIGKALEAYNGGGNGKVLLYVSPGWHDPDIQLADSGNLNITGSSEQTFEAWAGGYKFERKAGFSDAVIARLKAGFISAKKIVVDGPSDFLGQVTASALNVTGTLQASIINSGSLAVNQVSIAGESLRDYIVRVVSEAGVNNGNDVTSPLGEFDRLATNIISPLGSEDIEIQGDVKIKKTASASGNLSVEGNASVSGSLTAQNASIAGTLRASKIIADDIEGLEAKIGTLAATTIINNTNIYQSSSSGSTQSASGSASATASGSGALSTLASLTSSSIYTDYASIASLSAALAYVPNLSADFATFQQGLMAFGPSSLSDVSVAGQLSVNGSLIIAENSVNVLGGTLELQPLRQGNLAFMGGLISIDTDGNMNVGGNATFAKDVLVQGVLAANVISPVPGSDLIVRLPNDTSSFVIADASSSAKFKVDNKGNVIASGSAKFGRIASDIFNVIRGAQADTSLTETIATASAGTAKVKTGQFERTIVSPFVTEDSLIYITPTTDTKGVTPFVARQTSDNPETEEIEGSFTIRIPQTVIGDIEVNWWIVN